MTIGRRFWFYHHGENAEADGYRQAGKATAAFLQANGTEAWPVLSNDPEQDYQTWKKLAAGTVVPIDGEDRRLSQ